MASIGYFKFFKAIKMIIFFSNKFGEYSGDVPKSVTHLKYSNCQAAGLRNELLQENSIDPFSVYNTSLKGFAKSSSDVH